MSSPSPLLRRSLLQSALPLLALALLCSPAAGAAIVDWGGNYVATYTPLNVSTPVTGGGSTTYAYSDTVPVSPAGPTFYGAFSITNSSGTGTPEFTNGRFGLNQGTPNTLRFGSSAGAGDSQSMRGLVFFKKADFLTGPTGTVTFDNTSSLSLNISTSVGDTRVAKMAVYALVGGEWNWYLSQNSRTGSGLFSIPDPATINWAVYSINASTAPLNQQPGAALYNVAGSSFQDIGAVGYFFNVGIAPALNGTMYLSSFQVNATVTPIPEPKISALLLGGGALAMISAYRARKASTSLVVRP